MTKRVAEIIHIVEEQKQAFIDAALNPGDEALNVLWVCGVRKQQYFALNDYIVMTFEYEGDNFTEDMNKMAAYLDTKGILVKTRRKDVPIDQRSTSNWWAPIKRLGTLLETKPSSIAEHGNEDYISYLDGYMDEFNDTNDIAYDEDEWLEELGIWKNI